MWGVGCGGVFSSIQWAGGFVYPIMQWAGGVADNPPGQTSPLGRHPRTDILPGFERCVKFVRLSKVIKLIPV